MKRHTVITDSIDDTEFELTFEPVGSPMKAKVGDTIVVGYLSYDTDCRDVEDLMGDCMGKLLSFHKHARSDHAEGLAALGRNQYGDPDPDITPDRDAVLLDCYEHGGQMWSVSGGGMQCRWDTARGAGVWVPDDCLRSQLDDDEREGKDRAAQAVIYAKQFLNSYNDIINGNVYGVVIETYDLDGGHTNSDHCWGYIGSEYAEDELKSQFEYACKSVEVPA